MALCLVYTTGDLHTQGDTTYRFRPEEQARFEPLVHRVRVGQGPLSPDIHQEIKHDKFSLELGKSPIDTTALRHYLKNYPNREDAQTLIDGFTKGFRLGYTGSHTSTDCKNLKSARLNPKLLQEKLHKEIALGRMAGPFKSAPFPITKISPVGFVPKPDGSHRLITHLSHPVGDSVNDGISDELSSVSYTKFDNVADMVCKLGLGTSMAKRDIKSAFRLLPISPADFWLLGLKDENGYYYIDKFLPMGCKISSALFEKFATFIHWLVSCLADSKTIDHYLDDFFFCGSRDTNVCENNLHVFTSVCKELRVPIAEEKSVGPCAILIFLGLELDSNKMVVRIPPSKLSELRLLLVEVLGQRRTTLRKFQALIGKLSFFSRAIRSSRAFLRRFYDIMSKIRKPHHRIRISGEVRHDILMWLSFLDHFNGVTHIPPTVWNESNVLKLYTDSAGSHHLGCGCICQNEWCFFQWPAHWPDSILGDLTFLEMVPVLLAIILWAKFFKGRKLVMFIDNEALVSVLNKQSSRSQRVMHLVRNFVLIAMEYEILFHARHVPSECNSVADSISRKQWARFRELAPEADMEPREIPERFASIICKTKLSGC